MNSALFDRLKQFPLAPETYGLIRAIHLVIVPKEIWGDIPKVIAFVDQKLGTTTPAPPEPGISAPIPARRSYVWTGEISEDVSGSTSWTRRDTHTVSLEIPEEYLESVEAIEDYVMRHYNSGIENTEYGDEDNQWSSDDDRSFNEITDSNAAELEEQFANDNPEED